MTIGSNIAEEDNDFVVFDCIGSHRSCIYQSIFLLDGLVCTTTKNKFNKNITTTPSTIHTKYRDRELSTKVQHQIS